MAKYPKRVDAHTKETEAMAILKSQLPSKWMIRETTERDYGIDCYIELVTEEGDVIGDILAGQLKGTAKLLWKEKKGRV